MKRALPGRRVPRATAARRGRRDLRVHAAQRVLLDRKVPRATAAKPGRLGKLGRLDRPGRPERPAPLPTCAASMRTERPSPATPDEVLVSALCKGGGAATLQDGSARCTGATGIVGICMKK